MKPFVLTRYVYDAISLEKEDMEKRAPDMQAMLDYWDQTDSIIGGIKTLRKADKKYFPKFVGESENQYEARKKLTKFTNIYRDIVESLASKPFEEEVDLVKKEGDSIPSKIGEFAEDVDGSGQNLTMFANDIFYNGINSGIDWIFVDYPSVDISRSRTVAEVEAARERPFWSRILARNVLEARIKILNGEECLSYIRILEPGEDKNRVRIIQLSEKRVATWQLYVEVKGESIVTHKYKLDSEGRFEGIDCIPIEFFMTGRREGRTFKFSPVMQDAADLSIELYQEESGLKYAKRLTAYPMLTGNGVKPDKDSNGKPKPLGVGPGTVLYAEPNGEGVHGEWRFIEPNAQSLRFLAEDIVEIKRDLRELGRQPLTAQNSNLTVITTQVAAGKARTAVNAWVLNLTNSLEKLLKITAQWYGIEYEPVVNVFNEFDNFIDGKDYEVLQKMREAGDISYETYCDELKRRGLLSPEFNTEDEIKRILSDPFIENEDDDDEPTE